MKRCERCVCPHNFHWKSVQRKESTDGSYTNIVTNFDYSPIEQLTTISYANGATTTNTYDSTKLYRLSSKVTTISGGSHAQDLAYTYDANGNVTQIVDASATSTSKTANYTYDPLNRLTSATITNVASGQSPYTETYAYDAIGNITSKNGQSYTYSQANYANPNAVTSIGNASYLYDNNGNELTKGTSLTNTWDYDNRLTQTVSGQTTVTYGYDPSGQRIKYSNGTTTSYYPSKYYNTDGTTQKKHIFANGIEVGVVTGTGANATVRYIHTDHLTGSNIVTNSSNTSVETLDYYPFGGIRIDSGSFNEQRKYAGHEYDSDTTLSYMNARYYDSGAGRFVSEDPSFLSVTSDLTNPQDWNSPRTTGELNSMSGFGWRKNTQSRGNSMFGWDEYLADPQAQNSYSYARNNPLKYTDPDGKFYQLVAAAGVGFLGGVASQYASDVINNYQSGKSGKAMFTEVSSGKTYAARGMQGTAIGLSALSGNLYIIGGVAVGTSVLADKWLGKETSWTQTAVDTAVTVGTAGVLKTFPKVPGRLPSSITNSAFWTGKHTQEEVVKETINVLVDGIKETARAISDSFKQLQKGY